MNTREWALVAFTILTQMTIGSFLVLGVVHYYAAQKKGMAAADRMSDRALLSLIPVLGLALLASLFHLGNPLNAPRAVTNLATSWLSREILFTVLFGGLAVVFTFMQWHKIGAFAVRNVIAWLAAIVGIVNIYSMARVYMIPTMPSWNTIATPITFFATTLLLGSLAMGAAYIITYFVEQKKGNGTSAEEYELLRDALRGIAIVSMAMLGVEFVVLPIYLGYLGITGGVAAMSASIMVKSYGVVFVMRLLLAFLGAGIFGAFLYQNADTVGREKVLGYLVICAFILVLAGEVMGRFLFYVSEYRIGV